MKPHLKKIIIISITLISALIFFLNFNPFGGHFPLLPDINTGYTNGFSKEKFNSIKPGTKIKEVEKILGLPFNYKADYYYYLLENKCEFVGIYSFEKRRFLGYASREYIVFYDIDSNVVAKRIDWYEN